MRRPTAPITARYAAFSSSVQCTTPSTSERSSTTPWYSGVTRMNACERGGVLRDREERGREQEQRDDREVDVVEVEEGAHERGGREPGAREPKPISTATGAARTAHHDSTSPNSTIVSRNTVE